MKWFHGDRSHCISWRLLHNGALFAGESWQELEATLDKFCAWKKKAEPRVRHGLFCSRNPPLAGTG